MVARGAAAPCARGEGALLPGDHVAWSEVALLLLNTWPRARLLETLGAHAASLPKGLHLTRVRWRLPLYLVQALERQANIHTRPIEDCVADALDLAIDDETLAALRNNRTFREAYEFPDDGAPLRGTSG